VTWFKVLLILYAILLNKVTQDLWRYTKQNLEMTGYMHSKQTQIAKFNFVQCLTNYSKSSAVHIADEQSVALHKLCMTCCYNGLNEVCVGLPP